MDPKVKLVDIVFWSLMGLAFVALLVLSLKPEWEIAVSAQFFDPNRGWIFNEYEWVQGIYFIGGKPALVLAISGVLILIGAFFWEPLKAFRLVSGFFVISMILGPGLIVNAGFKDHFGRPRPRDIQQFNGDFEYMRVGQPNWGGPGKSFPSGHASMGYFIGIPYFIFRKRNQILALGFLLAGVAGGALVGGGRIVQGGHFLGDVIAAGLCVFFSAGVVWWGLNRIGNRKSEWGNRPPSP